VSDAAIKATTFEMKVYSSADEQVAARLDIHQYVITPDSGTLSVLSEYW
jgi:hypothetical protein